MILTVGNIKGGVGKTTVAINTSMVLANEGYDVLFIDADSQGSGSDFFNKRDETWGSLEISVLPLDGKGIRREIDRLAGKYDHIIIDTPGSDNLSLRVGICVSDMLAVPVIPQVLDIWAMEKTNILLEECRTINPDIRVLCFINMVAPRGIIYEREARAAIPKFLPDCEVLKSRIVRRQAFANTLANGMYIMEHGDDKARKEFMAFYRELTKDMENSK